ncbi:Calx-beta domain-containing protein [Microcystis aeruginosa]|uniref:Calx-beta domain-containing protein n=1 Tax=Microcystis aeruginosa FD4 TaxID=2686288 RepID=A0A857D5C1_MICAE|nr:Calx-beta domain-containing protein [Microcystis aeruginosa]QGZ90469.1 hypothetical protein GQR42_13920 [Microcystis aeruginosa FD4]
MTSSLLPILPAVDDILFNFAQSDDFWANLAIAFGTSYDVVKATELRNQWQSRNFSQLPPIEVLSGEVLGTAKGAYAVSTNKIYLSESFLNVASSESLVKVILEEIGHYVDAQVNRVDTVGDEGELFSHLVRGVNLTEAELTYIQTEDDRSVINLGGQFIGVEQAAPITLIVNTTIDENDGSATIGTGLSLRDAVTIANTSPNTPYIIKLKSGTTYELTYVNNTTTGDRSLGTKGTITIEADGTALASIVNNASPIPRQNDNNRIIINSNASQLGVTLNNLYISNKAGRGIYNSGTLTLTNNTITGNTANYYGGGIFNAGSATLTNNTITGNKAVYGGGISNEGTLTINNNTITGNTANYDGGGIRNAGSATLTNNTISGNTANVGGGIDNEYGGTLTLTNNTISGNSGGGISQGTGTLTLTNNIISGNTGDYVWGGGISNANGTLTLTNNIITGNSAGLGGGIYNHYTGTWSSNSIISGNTANRVWYGNPDEHPTTDKYSWTIGGKLIANPIHPTYPNIFDAGTFTALPPTPNPPPKPTISVSNAWVDIPAGTNQTKVLTFEVKLSSTYDKPITVDYYTLDGSANSIDSTQLKDFNNVVKQTLSFFPGETSKQIEITVLGSAPPTDQTFEILAKDTAYRDWTDTDKGKEVDKKYDYSDLGYEGYRINKVFKDSTTGFDAFGLTSDEKFFLVLANPLNANEFTSNSNNLLQDIANTSGGNNTAAYTAGQNLINQLTSANQSYTFTNGTIYDLAKPPVLAIQGTQSLQDLLSDATTQGIGYDQFTNNKAAVNQWLSEVTNPVSGLTLKPNITGHSLGGALSQWVGGSYTGQLGKIVTFNSPGISQQPGINLNATNNLGVTHYITSADLISMAGSKYLSGVWNLEKYSQLRSAITLKKHSVPVLNQTITRTNLSKPTDLIRKVANGNTTDLSDYWFTYLPDADYSVLQLAVAKTLNPLLAAALGFRGTTENARKTAGTFKDAFDNIISTLETLSTIVQTSLQKAYDAMQSWLPDAYDAIIRVSRKTLEFIFGTGNTSSSNLALQSLSQTSNATAQSTEINNFWDAAAYWVDDAWQATTKWSGDAWKSIDEWTPQTWQATTTWTAADWNRPFFTISNPTIAENNSGTNNLVFKVTLSTTSTQTITVNYATANNTATAGSDYIAKTGTLTFTPGQISQDIIISVNGDTAIEPNETFLINLSNPSNALITDNEGLGTITNDDVSVTPIEAFGNTKLVQDTTNKLYTQIGNNNPIAINISGTQITTNIYPGWQTLAAETVNGVNQVLWKYNDGNYLHLWSLDSNWNWQSSTGWWGLNSSEAFTQETNFQQDFNGDGIIGQPYTTIETFGNTKLVQDTTNKLYAQIGNNNPTAINISGTQITTNTYSGWQTLAAETVNGVNQVLWKYNDGNYLHLWSLDSNWNWQSSTGWWGLNSSEAFTQETNFQQDFNSDGVIGQPFTPIETFGNTKLVKDATNKLYTQIGNNNPIAIKIGATQITTNIYPGWQTLAAETVNGVNQVLWKYNDGNYLHLWTLDSNWNWQSSTGWWGLNSSEAFTQETNFQQDFNGDNQIGNPLPNIASSLAVSANVPEPIIGSSNDDILTGTLDNDILIGGLGKDTITGGAGSDQFTFNNRNEGIDTITDFLSSQGDKIALSAAGFGGGLAAGVAITAAQFVLGTTALNASNRLIYNTITGGLFFDGDGTDTLAAIQIATLSSKPSISASDIFVLV